MTQKRFVCGLFIAVSSAELKTEADVNDISRCPRENPQISLVPGKSESQSLFILTGSVVKVVL